MRAAATLATAAVVLSVSTEARAESCKELPAPAWHGSPTVTIAPLGIPIGLPAVAGAKMLYQQALCGDDPERIWSLVESGEGELIAIEPALAASLHAATPHLPRADFVYVRGGGVGQPMAVILFTNGYNGPFFRTDENQAWTEAEANRAADFWNVLPFEYVLNASRWLHDVAKYKSSYEVVLEGTLLGILPFEIPLGIENVNRALANPLGSMLMPAQNIQRDAEVWVHELAHYNHYEISGLNPILYADDFGKISRRNARILFVEIPAVFKELHGPAGEERHAHCSWASDDVPYGYVSSYAYCGELAVLEDFADSLSIALGASEELVAAQAAGAATPDLSRYKDNYHRTGYSTDLLYGRLEGERDSDVLGDKADYMRARFSLSP